MSAIPLHILICENNALDADFIKRRLAKASRIRATFDEVAWLSGALTALANRHNYGLILLDLGLNDSQGIDTVVAVTQAAPNVPIIILSGNEDSDIAAAGAKYGAQAYLVKSTDMTTEHLERTIRGALVQKGDDLQKKRMLLESHARLSQAEDLSGKWSLVEPHMRCIEDSISKGLAYLMRIAPSHYLELEELLKSEGYYVAMRELRSILLLSSDSVPTEVQRETWSAIKASQSMIPTKRPSPVVAGADIANNTLNWGNDWDALSEVPDGDD